VVRPRRGTVGGPCWGAAVAREYEKGATMRRRRRCTAGTAVAVEGAGARGEDARVLTKRAPGCPSSFLMRLAPYVRSQYLKSVSFSRIEEVRDEVGCGCAGDVGVGFGCWASPQNQRACALLRADWTRRIIASSPRPPQGVNLQNVSENAVVLSTTHQATEARRCAARPIHGDPGSQADFERTVGPVTAKAARTGDGG
jgi:hypothetical protein